MRNTEKVILIELFQPFAQYRNPFTFYYAQTYPLPPKSTIVGMLQNATNRYYDQEFWKIKISVHGGFESIFWNYQQLIKGEIELVKTTDGISLWNQKRPLYNQGITSQRSPVYQQELFNGHLFVFLKGESDLIKEIETALKNPKRILYLGRSEDVVFIRNIYNQNNWKYEIKNSVPKYFRLTYPTYIKQKVKDKNGNRIEFPIKNQKFPVYSITTKVIFKNEGKPIENKAQITKNTERKSDFETVIYTGTDYIVLLNEPIKLEYFRLADKTFKIPKEFGWI